MTMDEAVAAFESRFESVKTGEPCAYLVEGIIDSGEYRAHAYVIIGCGGERDDGAEATLVETPEEAIAQWSAAADAYAERVGGKRLVWRLKPELKEHPDMRRKARWDVYSRLVVY